jgi:hypothetical protein
MDVMPFALRSLSRTGEERASRDWAPLVRRFPYFAARTLDDTAFQELRGILFCSPALSLSGGTSAAAPGRIQSTPKQRWQRGGV